MLAGDVRYALRSVLHDYSKFGIANLIQDAIGLLQNREQYKAKDFVDKAQHLVSIANKAKKDLSYNFLSKTAKELLSEGEFGHLTPDKALKLISSSLNLNIAKAIPSAELEFISQQVANMLPRFQNYVSLSDDLNIKDYEIAENEALLRLHIPRSLFHNYLSELGSTIQRFDTLFDAVSEYVSGPNSKPRIVSISTSDFIAILAGHADEVIAIAKMFGSLLDALKKQVELYSALKIMRTAGLPEESIKALEDSADVSTDKIRDEKIHETMAALKSEGGSARNAELMIRITKVSKLIIKDMSEGAGVSLEVENQKQLEVLGGNRFSLSQQQLLDLVHSTNDDHAAIVSRISQEGLKLISKSDHDPAQV